MSKEIDTIIELYAKEGYVITREYAEVIDKGVKLAKETWDKNKSVEQ